MALKVLVSKHAADRLQQRCGIRVNAYTEIRMDSNYVKVFSNMADGEQVNWYVNRNGNERAVMIVTAKNAVLKTIMTEGDSVDFALAKLAALNNQTH